MISGEQGEADAVGLGEVLEIEDGTGGGSALDGVGEFGGVAVDNQLIGVLPEWAE